MNSKDKINRHFTLTEEENRKLASGAERCGMSQSAYVKSLIIGYTPKEKPDKIFYDLLKDLYNKLNDLESAEAISEDLSEEVRSLLYRIEVCYLRPRK